MNTIRLAAVVAMLVVPLDADARVWTVGPRGADFPLIAPAITASAPGDVIRVAAGVYREDLVISHPLVIEAEEGAILFGTGRGTVIDITAPDCEIRGLTIDGTGTGGTNKMDAAIRVTTNGNRIVANHIRRAFYGIVLAGASGNVVERNQIVGLASEPFGRRGDGIYVYRSQNNRIAYNLISDMRDAIYLQYASGGVVEHNVIEDSRYGLHDMFSDRTRITGNIFRRSSVGANLMNSKSLILEDNEFVRNRGIAAVGLALKECDHSEIRGNKFAGNGRGLQVDGSSRNHFIANRFVQNDLGIRLAASAEANVFAMNEFRGNWSDVVASGRGTSTQWDLNGTGNMWSAYAGFDFDGDGIGDAPHSLSGPFERVEGRNANARLFLQSPAASALALIAKMSPGADGMIDFHPVAGAARPMNYGSLWIALVGIAGGAMTRKVWRSRCSS